jgi:hypothetical protein
MYEGAMRATEELPPSVTAIAEFLAMAAKGYGNHLKWNEKAMFKADLMNLRRRWLSVDPGAFAAKLRDEGMRDDDVAELVGWLTKAQAGRRLVPQRSYRQFQFNSPPEQPEPTPSWTSPGW